MSIEGPGKLLRIFVSENDRYDGEPLYEAIVLKAKAMGICGATVLRGMIGYGANSSIHTTKILRLAENLPLIIEIIDKAEKIEALIPVIDEMVATEGLVTVENITIVGYGRGLKSF